MSWSFWPETDERKKKYIIHPYINYLDNVIQFLFKLICLHIWLCVCLCVFICMIAEIMSWRFWPETEERKKTRRQETKKEGRKERICNMCVY